MAHTDDPCEVHALVELHTALSQRRKPEDPDAMRRAVVLLLQREARRAGALGGCGDPSCACSVDSQ